MGSSIRMIVSDMDGTLLNDREQLTQDTIDTLIKAQQAGVILLLASGRSHLSLAPFARQLKMTQYGGYCLGVNGQQTTDLATGITTAVKDVDKEVAQRALQFAKEHQLEFLGVTNESLQVYIPDALLKRKQAYIASRRLSQDYWVGGHQAMVQRHSCNQVYYIHDPTQITHAMSKLVLAEDPSYLSTHRQAMDDIAPGRLEWHYVSPRWIEGMPQGVNKGAALQKLAQQLHIESDEILVFGDAENDLSMFQVVKHAVAMGNAMASVKPHASDTTKSNNDNGVAWAVRRYVLEADN